MIIILMESLKAIIYRLIMKRTHGISVAISQVHNHYRQFNPHRSHF